MLQAFDLSYSPDPRVGPLFQNLDISLHPGEVCVLMGRNGVGKTKLVEILAGLTSPSAGRVVCDEVVAYLPQDVDLSFAGSLIDFLLPDGEGANPGQLAKVTARLGITRSQLDQEYASLSIGERMRAAIAHLLLADPTVLLLDEPTNNLDLAAKSWLQGFLRQTPLAVLMVCHDRALVDAVAGRVLELTANGLREFAGGYSAMRHEKEIERENQASTYQRQLQEDRRLKASVAHAHENARKVAARPTGRTYDPKHKSFYEGKRAKLDRRAAAIRHRAEQLSEDHVAKPFEEPPMKLTFRDRPLRHAEALTVRGLAKAYGDRTLFANLNLTLSAGERLAIVGPNGAGKTTLFRLILGEETVDAGTIHWAADAEPRFLTQARSCLDPDRSVLEALNLGSREDERFARLLLGCLRISGHAVHRPVRVLSVGERTKVELTAILLTTCNVLILDEPTNHLDVDSVEALENALRDFRGSILFTSHDQAFIDRLADRTLELNEPSPP